MIPQIVGDIGRPLGVGFIAFRKDDLDFIGIDLFPLQPQWVGADGVGRDLGLYLHTGNAENEQEKGGNSHTFDL